MAMSSEEAYEKEIKDRKPKRKIYSSRKSRDRFEERMDFKFYDFKVLEIEKGWNQLFVSIISIETGETIAKSGKTLVQNGECHWEESMLSTLWISDYSLQDNQACLLKFLVAMGSPRFGTLGEATINLASYVGPETCTASLPLLQHCSQGAAILQVKIQCLTPRRNNRNNSNSYGEEMSVGYDDVDNISNVSDTTLSRLSSSSQCDLLENTDYRGELRNKRRGPQTTCSDHDIGSLENSVPSWIESLPQQSNVNGWKTNMLERQDSIYPKKGPYSLHNTSMFKYSSSTSITSSLGIPHQDNIDDFDQVSHASDSTPARSVCSSKDMLGAAQVTIELLHGEVKMWEENATKLMVDVKRLRKELNKKSKNKKDLEMELSASRKESDDLKEEIQRLTAMVKQNDSRSKMDNVIKELKDEIKYLKGLNYDLEVKLNKTQESNNNLASILRKSEKIIEKQKMEISNLSMTGFQFEDAESNGHGLEDSDEEDFSMSIEVLPEKRRNDFCRPGVDLSTNGNAITCLHEGIELQEFRNLELERRVMWEKQKNMESSFKFEEETMDEKGQGMQTGRCFMAQALEENEAKWSHRLLEKEKQIIDFETKLYDGFNAFSNEVLSLRERVQDLEVEFREKHEESTKDLVISGSFASNFLPFDTETAINFVEAFVELYEQIQLSVENLKDQGFLPAQMTFTKNESCFKIFELSKGAGKIDLKELNDAIMCTNILLKKLLESKASSFEYENSSQYELRNFSDLQSSNDDQNALFEREAKIVQLSEKLLGLEAEVKHLSEERELSHLALESSQNTVIYLQAEIRRMETKNDAQKVDLKIKGESMQKKWTEAQGECRFLKVANSKLQATNENLIEVSKTLQTTNGELRMQNLELHNRYSILESKLGRSQIVFSNILKLVEDLECKFTSMLEEIALKEKSINVDLEELIQESIKQDERFTIEEKYLTQMYMEKAVEVSNLQREVENLRDQISDIFDRHNRIASNVLLDVYDLCAEKAITEAALQEEEEKVMLYEAKFGKLQAEYDVMVQNYTEELASTRENQATLMVKHEKVLVLLENSKSNEEKLKNIVRRLEVELKDSELERLQAMEEISELEVQLQKTQVLQDTVFILKSSLYEAESEYRKLGATHQELSLEYEELKAKKTYYMQKLSSTEKVTSELEDCKRSKAELEEKAFRLEWDLTTKEASWRNNAQLKYELAQITRENGELRKKKNSLQQENEGYQKKVKALEEKLKQNDSKHDQYIPKEYSISTTAQEDLNLSKEENDCSSICIKSSEMQFLLPQLSNVTTSFLTEQYHKLG